MQWEPDQGGRVPLGQESRHGPHHRGVFAEGLDLEAHAPQRLARIDQRLERLR